MTRLLLGFLDDAEELITSLNYKRWSLYLTGKIVDPYDITIKIQATLLEVHI